MNKPLSTDAISEIIRDGYEHDCGNAACDICSLGPLVDESREQHIARLRERFRGQPEIFMPVADAQRRPPPPRPVMVPCPVCGKSRPVNGRCLGCLRRGLSAERKIVDCRRCGQPKYSGLACGLCSQRTAGRRRRAS